MKIALFDFDKTLYLKDSTVEFTKYLYKKHPRIFWYFGVQVAGALFYLLGIYTIERYKQLFYGYMRFLAKEEQGRVIARFWEKHYPRNFRKELLQRIADFNAHGIRSIVVTAAPDFLLKPLKSELNVDEIIATPFIVKEGRVRIAGKNCKGPEKVQRLKALYNFNSIQVTEAYSDNHDDWYMLNLADKPVKL